MQNSGGCAPTQSVSNVRFGRTAVVLLTIALLTAWGCGSGYTPSLTPTTPRAQNAFVSGQYNVVLTSTNGHGTTKIYTNFKQTGTAVKGAFTGAANTLVCPSNDLSKCIGNSPTISISLSGTVSGQNVTIVLLFPSTAGADTVTMVGTIGPSSGTYTDSLGDAGSWTASPAGSMGGNYSGTFNSTLNPLPIAPTILVTLGQDPNYNLTGTATLMNLPCISALTLAGPAIGGAFVLTDAANGASIIAVPDTNGLKFNYNFVPAAAKCAGDVGGGVLTIDDPWGY